MEDHVMEVGAEERAPEALSPEAQNALLGAFCGPSRGSLAEAAGAAGVTSVEAEDYLRRLVVRAVDKRNEYANETRRLRMILALLARTAPESGGGMGALAEVRHDEDRGILSVVLCCASMDENALLRGVGAALEKVTQQLTGRALMLDTARSRKMGVEAPAAEDAPRPRVEFGPFKALGRVFELGEVIPGDRTKAKALVEVYLTADEARATPMYQPIQVILRPIERAPEGAPPSAPSSPDPPAAP